MKKLLFLLGIPAILAGCQDDAILSDAVANGDGNISITITPDDVMASRSATNRSSAAGGLTNVDFDEYDLRYQLGIFIGKVTTNEDDEEVISYVPLIEPQTRIVSTPQAVTYSFNLTPGREYRAVAWADFVTAGSESDLHYKTSNFRNISLCGENVSMYSMLDESDEDPDIVVGDGTDDDIDDGNDEGEDGGEDGDNVSGDEEEAVNISRLNDESRDAYAISQLFEVGDNAQSLDLTLKRKFAKLRIITTDWDLAGVDKPDMIELTYDDCLNGHSIDIANETPRFRQGTLTYSVDLNEEKDYELNYDAADCNRTLVVDYLIAPISSYNSIHFTLKTYKDGTLLTTKTVDTDIPVRSNWLTTVMGNFLSTNNQITVECNEMFDDELNTAVSGSNITATEPESVDNVYYVSNAAELLWIDENYTTLNGASIKLTADIDLDGINWTPIFSTGYIVLFDGQGHTIYNLHIGSDMGTASVGSNIGLFGYAWDVSIKNLTLQNVSIIYGDQQVGGIAGLIDGIYNIENCTVNNFFARQKYYTTDKADNNSSCVGSLIGRVESDENAVIKNCHADNIDIEADIKVAGLVGNVSVSDDEKLTFEDCTVSNATLWIINKSWMETCGAVIGKAEGSNGTVVCSNCSSSNITYKYLEDGLLQLKSGDEGVTRTITIDEVEYNYGPKTSLIGYYDEDVSYTEN